MTPTPPASSPPSLLHVLYLLLSLSLLLVLLFFTGCIFFSSSSSTSSLFSSSSSQLVFTAWVFFSSSSSSQLVLWVNSKTLRKHRSLCYLLHIPLQKYITEIAFFSSFDSFVLSCFSLHFLHAPNWWLSYDTGHITTEKKKKKEANHLHRANR